jgi:hypothetical protein
MPPLAKMITTLTNQKMYASSLYRILRGCTRKSHTKGFWIKELPSVEELNNFVQRFELLFVCSMDLDSWIVDEDSVAQEKINNYGGESPQCSEV